MIFKIHLENHLANFNQTWHNASLGKGDSSLFNEGPRPFQRGDNHEIAITTLKKFKNLLQKSQVSIMRTFFSLTL